MLKVLWKKLDARAVIPEYATDGSNAVDLRVIIDKAILLRPNETLLCQLGLAIAIPKGWAGVILPRSGLGVKYGVVLGNLTGFIDSDYRGELMVCLWNRSSTEYLIKPDERIAQITFVQAPQILHVEVDELPETVRGVGGLGSTGKI